MKSVTTRTAAATHAFGRKLAAQLQVGDVVALIGELGAGKTCFAQGIAAGLGVQNRVTSPTYTLICEYRPPRNHRLRRKVGFPLYHMDLYRLESIADALQLGIEEYLGSDGVTVIEWAEKILDLLPERTIHVRLSVLADGIRRIQCSPWPSKSPAR